MSKETELSDEQIEKIAKPYTRSIGDYWCNETAIPDNGSIEDFARAIIAADRELRRGDAGMPVVAWYGLNTDGYEAVDLKENHVLRMFHAGEITAAPLVRQSDAQEALAAQAVEIEGLRKDAERYRALPSLDWYVGPEYEPHNDIVCRGKYSNNSISKSELDASIDAAIAKETTK